jgi:crotonobetainyl-CoA:carnitine CoA-transferase CaiB-like acyl-CoA transferase
MPNTAANWDGLGRAIGEADVFCDLRFTDAESRARNNVACIQVLDEVFGTRTLEEWSVALAAQSGPWAKVQTVTDLNDDEQAWRNGYLQKVAYSDGRTVTLAPAPVQFDEKTPTLRPAPAHAAHTEEVALELGLDNDRIRRLRNCGVIA